MTDFWISIVSWVIFALWALMLVPVMLLLVRRTLPRMTAGRQGASDDDSAALDSSGQPWPLLSVIVPARDEGQMIEESLRSLLSSGYPALEVIAVNDRSTDDTGAIMDRLAAGDERLRAVHVETLPDGWLGKTHAMHVGASRASGEYLLFTDGDILFTDDALPRAVQYAVRARLDHLCLMPRLLSGGYWETALTAYFGFAMSAGMLVWLVPTPFRWAYAGIGAFNLVRTEAYRAAGGHEPIRLDVLDDIKLGKLMKRHAASHSSAGGSDILVAGPLVQVRWQDSAAGVVRGLEKNAFAAVEYSLPRLLLVTVFWAAMSLLPYFAVAAMPDARCLGFAAAILFTHAAYALTAQRLGGSWLVFPVLPVAGLLMMWTFWRSAWVTLRQGGVRWRETFYPLDALRRGLF